jgi:rhodanese-related sulfurtransferase
MDTVMQHFSPRQAWEYLQQHPDTVFLDVRTEMEYLYVGHPPGVRHVAWVEYPDFVADAARFVAAVESEGITRDDTIMLICRSGKRSRDAGAALEAAGFTRLLHVDEGFEGDLDDNNHRNTINGWRAAGLPWAQF